MTREDKDLAFMLQYENIAWYENGMVRILDRRIYPAKIEFVVCKNYKEVRNAIADMVTQSGGPFTAAAMGMALAAYECRDKTKEEQKKYLLTASDIISHARPTTVAQMSIITKGCYDVAVDSLESGMNVPSAIVLYSVSINNARYKKIETMAKHLVNMFPKKSKILTQCFGETIVGQMLKIAKKENKDVKVYCAETRPYFQGSRLTATVASEMGFDTTVITDNMPAYTIENEKIDIFTSAADVICLDGHVVNKVGTFQIAIVSKYMGIPYFVTGAPNKAHEFVSSVEIEMRNPSLVLESMGTRVSAEGVKGYYPAFDITPPHLVSGVVTDDGVYSPYDLKKYFELGNTGGVLT